jgi:hypothetical protein
MPKADANAPVPLAQIHLWTGDEESCILPSINPKNSLIWLADQDCRGWSVGRSQPFLRPKKGPIMRFLAALGVICALSSQTALGKTQDCKTIEEPDMRLTCYDEINPPTATYPVPLPKPSQPIPTTRPDGAGYVDPQHDEDALVRAQMRNICRGC